MQEYDLWSDELATLVHQARKENDEDLISFLRSLWENESWESIQKKLDTDDSTWIVWWLDGVKALAAHESAEE